MSVFCSWSGGKDSALALYHAMQAGRTPRHLLTMMTPDGERSRSNGLSRRLLELQATSLGLPIKMIPASWDAYESAYLAALTELRDIGVVDGVFGDIDIPAHRHWAEQLCARAGLGAMLPLWQRDRTSIIEELTTLGFNAVIVAVHASKLCKELLGRSLNPVTVSELEASSVDICGENGEYHTAVTAAPHFSFPVSLGAAVPVLHDGYWVLSEDA